MTDIVERLRDLQDYYSTSGQLGPENQRIFAEAAAEIERLRTALQALHDWYVEYASLNNLFNADGSPATFHELLEARRILEGKP